MVFLPPGSDSVPTSLCKKSQPKLTTLSCAHSSNFVQKFLIYWPLEVASLLYLEMKKYIISWTLSSQNVFRNKIKWAAINCIEILLWAQRSRIRLMNSFKLSKSHPLSKTKSLSRLFILKFHFCSVKPERQKKTLRVKFVIYVSSRPLRFQANLKNI